MPGQPPDDAAAVVPFRIWPPVAFGVPLLVGVLLSSLALGDPFDLPAWRVPVGWLLVAAFALWNGWSLLFFARARTGLLPGQETSRLMTSGPFAVSRNPLYLGLASLYVGICLLVPSVWGLLLLPLAVAAVDWGAIRPEESFLRRQFGASYEEYAQRVRRWL
jgi:protein-S-isoprenylcysteine O-methyltransferase Ste14